MDGDTQMRVYLNGEIVPAREASVSVFDRGFLFGDGIYEGLRAFDGEVFAVERHIERMREGLGDAGIEFDPATLIEPTHHLLKANATPDAFVYWQITRGTPGPDAPVRSRLAPSGTPPTALAYCVPAAGLDGFETIPTQRARTAPDLRWLRGQMKSISLLGNVLTAREVYERDGAGEAIMVRDGLVTEACACNVVLALPDGSGPGGTRLVTPSLDSAPILAGVTRAILLERLEDLSSEPVPAEWLERASEVMLLGTMAMVTSVTQLDGRPVGDGTPGPGARRLLDELTRAIREDQAARAQGVGARTPA